MLHIGISGNLRGQFSFRNLIGRGLSVALFLATTLPSMADSPANSSRPELEQADVSVGEIPADLFGSRAVVIPGQRFSGSWNSLLQRQVQEKRLAACNYHKGQCSAKLQKWLNLIASLRNEPRLVQVKRINEAANGLVRYGNDLLLFGKRDYWATPAEALTRGGDCEDYATIKYFALRALGFEEGDLRIAIVRDERVLQLHALLVVALDSKLYILDNQLPGVADHRYVSQYTPVYSFTTSRQWVHIAPRTAGEPIHASLTAAASVHVR